MTMLRYARLQALAVPAAVLLLLGGCSEKAPDASGTPSPSAAGGTVSTAPSGTAAASPSVAVPSASPAASPSIAPSPAASAPAGTKAPAAVSPKPGSGSAASPASDTKEEQALRYLQSQVPELAAYGRRLTDAGSKLVLRIEGLEPLKADGPGYYIVYAGEDQSDHTVRWNTFYVRKDLKEVLVLDIASGTPVRLAAWRQKQGS